MSSRWSSQLVEMVLRNEPNDPNSNLLRLVRRNDPDVTEITIEWCHKSLDDAAIFFVALFAFVPTS